MSYVLRETPVFIKSYGPKVYYIDTNLARWILNKVNNSNTEVCASLKPKSNKPDTLVVISETINYGPVLDPNVRTTRGVCKFKRHTDVLLHTHPAFAESHPTTDDILDTIKYHKNVQVTIIGTKWGIWVMYNKYDKPAVHSPSNESLLRERISNELEKINIATRDYQGGSRKLRSSDLRVIADSILKIDNMSNMAIDLYPWSNLIGNIVNIQVTLYDHIPSRPV